MIWLQILRVKTYSDFKIMEAMIPASLSMFFYIGCIQINTTALQHSKNSQSFRTSHRYLHLKILGSQSTYRFVQFLLWCLWPIVLLILIRSLLKVSDIHIPDLKQLNSSLLGTLHICSLPQYCKDIAASNIHPAIRRFLLASFSV